MTPTRSRRCLCWMTMERPGWALLQQLLCQWPWPEAGLLLPPRSRQPWWREPPVAASSQAGQASGWWLLCPTQTWQGSTARWAPASKLRIQAAFCSVNTCFGSWLLLTCCAASHSLQLQLQWIHAAFCFVYACVGCCSFSSRVHCAKGCCVHGARGSHKTCSPGAATNACCGVIISLCVLMAAAAFDCIMPGASLTAGVIKISTRARASVKT